MERPAQQGPAGESPPVPVCLVHMPYSDLEWPAIGLPLLKAYLHERGIGTRIFYANLDFAAAVGLELYRAIGSTAPEILLGEWTFSRAAFRDEAPDESSYLTTLSEQLARPHCQALRRLYGEGGGLPVLAAVRNAAPAFIDALARHVLTCRPRIVGCTSMFQQHCPSLALLRRVKELSPETVTMIGGANCEGTMGEATHRLFPWLDFVMSGEVDAFFGDLCETILEEGAEAAARRAPPSVYGPPQRSRSDRRRLPSRAVLHRLDEAAVPEFDDYFAAIEQSPLADSVFPGGVFESSRGCWWGEKHHCTFCGLSDVGLVFRSKSADRFVDEVLGLRERYDVGWLVAVDAIIDTEHIRTALPELASREGGPYLFFEVKANLKRKQVKLLGRAGIRTIQPGIESLHDEFLKLIVKGNRWFTNVQLLKWAQEAGISVNWNFLAGAPGERDEWYSDVARWLPAIYHLEPPGSDTLVTIRYDRYSVYHSRQEEFGLELEPSWAYRRVYPVSDEGLDGLAYYFEDARDATTRPGLGGEGHRAVNRRLVEWHQAFRDRCPARLTAREENGSLLVHDTRPLRDGDKDEPLVFEGLEGAILKACDSAQSEESLDARLRSLGHRTSQKCVRAAVEGLKERHLLLEWYGRILSLYVREPVTPYLTPAERPGVRTRKPARRPQPVS